MKFVLVNHRAPLNRPACSACAEVLGTGYLRDVSTQTPYCDYDCYLRDEARSLFMPWLKTSCAEADSSNLPASPPQLMTSFAAASCLYSMSLAALRMGELMAVELSNTVREGTWTFGPPPWRGYGGGPSPPQ